MKLLLICLLCVFAFVSTGCASVERALAIYEARAEQADEAHKAWSNAIHKLEEAKGDLRDFQREWESLDKRIDNAETALEAAIASGDAEAVEAARKGLEDSKNKLTLLKDRGELVLEAVKRAGDYADDASALYKSSADVAKAAAEDFESAKSTSDYIGTILGWLGLGVTALLTGGKAVQLGSKLKASRRETDDAESAIRRVFKTNKATLDENVLGEVKAANVKYMTLAEREAARRATR